MANWWMERRSSRLMEPCSWAFPGKTPRPGRLRFWAVPAGSEAGRAPARFGSGSEGERKNAASEKAANSEGIHAAGDDDRAGSSGCRRFGFVRDAGGLLGLHAGLAIRFHRAAEGGRSRRSDLHREIYEQRHFRAAFQQQRRQPRWTLSVHTAAV